MRRGHFFALLLTVLIPLSLHAQVFRVNSDNRRTIEATATEKISVPADVAIVRIGFSYSGDTKDTAYTEIVKVGNKILKALSDAGIPSDEVQSESLTMGREEESYSQKASSTPKHKYSAEQDWRVRVSAADAQKVVDLAVAAGANNIQGVEWNVSDQQTLRAKAYGAALERAKETAAQSASQAGVKLGELVSIISGEETEAYAKIAMHKKVPLAVEAQIPQSLVLYPARVEREATVTAIYAIAQDSQAH